MLQLNPQIPVITPKGNGWAFFMIDRSQEHDLEWVVFLDSNGECWTFKNSDIRIQKNYTLHRNLVGLCTTQIPKTNGIVYMMKIYGFITSYFYHAA